MIALLYPISVIVSLACIFGADYVLYNRVWRSTVIWGTFLSLIPIMNLAFGIGFLTGAMDSKNGKH
ncbi:MAG TPA: hypothetical protein VFM18_17590 [Methanosarcina sp.]|nr:hypothetical protein [Methanosarcina sp.]